MSDPMFEVPQSRLKQMTDTIAALREELAEAKASMSVEKLAEYRAIWWADLRAERDALQAKLDRVNAWLIEGDPEISLRLILDAAPSASLAEHDAKVLEDAANDYASGKLTGIFMGPDGYPRAWLRARAESLRVHAAGHEKGGE